MQVIFTENVPGVGVKGDIKNVKPGFFRNYLLPYQKAVPATEPLLKQWEEYRKKMLIEKEQLRAKLGEIKERLAASTLTIEKKVTKKGTLYGGVKASDVVLAIKAGFNIEIPEEAVVLPQAIKTAGTHQISLKLGEGISTAVPLEVVAQALMPLTPMPHQGKILALDIGEKRVGYAISSEDQSVAFPRTIIIKKSDQQLIEKVSKIIENERIFGVVIGLPLDQDNKPTKQAEKIKLVGEKLEAVIKIPIFYVDEAGTTDKALAKIPFRADRHREKGFRDAIAAQIILERYLDAHD